MIICSWLGYISCMGLIPSEIVYTKVIEILIMMIVLLKIQYEIIIIIIKMFHFCAYWLHTNEYNIK